MIDKEALKAALLALEETEVSRSETSYHQYLDDAARDTTEPTDADDQSKRFENAEVADSLETSIRTYADALEVIRRVDFGPKHHVSEGAAIRVDGRWLVVAVSTRSFNVGKLSFMGISTSAPLYQAIEGKSAGEQVNFRGREIKIDAVE